MDPISSRPTTHPTTPAIDAAGPSAAAGVQAGSGEALAQRAELLLQIAGGLAGHEQNSVERERAIDGLTKLIADLSADRQALLDQRAALSSPQAELDPHVLQLIERLADPDTKKAMRLANKNLKQDVDRDVRSFATSSRWSESTASGVGSFSSVPKLSELPAIVKEFPDLETLDLGQSLDCFDAGTLAPLAGLKKLRALEIPRFAPEIPRFARQIPGLPLARDSRGLCDQLAELTQLERLTTLVDQGYADPHSNYTLTDSLLARLTPLSQLKQLPQMSLTSQQGVEDLGRFTKLEALTLLMPAATDERLESLAGTLAVLPLTYLSLEVDARQVTERGLGHLQSALADKSKSGYISVCLRRLPKDFPAQPLHDFAATLCLEKMRSMGSVIFQPLQAQAAG